MESQQKVTISIPIEFNQEIRDNLAEDILDFILRRTERGLDKNNKPFKRYSDSYAESLDFKIAGKSKNHVDLQLSGDMLTELQILNTSIPGFITIGFPQGSEENDRAAWQRNNTRSYFPKRDFLGIEQSDLNKLISKYRIISQAENLQEREVRKKIREEATRIVSSFLFNRSNE